MSTNKLQLLRCFLTERLTAAAVEIFGEVESVVEEYREENNRLQQTLNMLRPDIRLHRADELFSASPTMSIEQSSEQSPGPAGENPEPWLVRIKEEQEEHATSPGGDALATANFILTPTPVKSDVDQDSSLPQVSHAFRVIKVESNDDSQSTFSAVDMASDHEGGTPEDWTAPNDPTQPSAARQKKGKKCSRCEECKKSLKKKGGKAASKKKKVKRPMQKTMLEFPRSTLYKPFTGKLPDPKAFISKISEAFKDLPDDKKPLIAKMGLSSDVELVDCAFGLVPKGCPLSYQCPVPSSRDYSPHNDAPPPPPLPLASHAVEKVWPPPTLQEKDKMYMITLETSWDAAHHLEFSTRGATETVEGLQKLRITSRFREICHLKAGRSHGEHLAFKMQRGIPESKAFKRDREQRPEALREYCKHVFVNWSPCGMVVHPDAPWLGAIPDGLVYDPSEKPKYGLVHVRCPKIRSFIDCHFLDFQFGILELKKSHPYYWQIQGEMLVTGMAWCDFVVYTEDDILVQRIYRNQAMILSMKPKLDNFFFQYYLPGLTAV